MDMMDDDCDIEGFYIERGEKMKSEMYEIFINGKSAFTLYCDDYERTDYIVKFIYEGEVICRCRFDKFSIQDGVEGYIILIEK